jgi:hypothetical protein
MPEGDPLDVGYIRWLSVEVGGLPEMFAGVNENFISTAVEGALVMAGESVDLNALQDTAAVNEPNILPTDQDVWRAVRVVLKKWWCSFGYDYVLGAIPMMLCEATVNV